MQNNNGFAPAKRSLGQNFLVDQNICRRIVDAVEPESGSTVLEIGPGRGALTGFLLEAGPERCLALEKDRDLAAKLGDNFPGVEVTEGDALTFNWADVEGPNLKLAGNLPYNVASRIIWDVVSRLVTYDRAIFMVQHEVALRLCASHGSKQFGALTAWVQAHADVEYLFKVPPSVFRPQPKVVSAVVKFIPVAVESRPTHGEKLEKLLKMCFQKRRKQLKNILKDHLSPGLESWMHEQQMSLTLRPEALSVSQFVALSERI